MSGKNYHFVSYGVDENGFIDYAALAKQVAKVRPKLLVAGASAYPRAIDFEKLAAIAHGYGAMLMVDMAHIAGLVAGGVHQNPRALRRRGDHHHPQNAARPPRRPDPDHAALDCIRPSSPAPQGGPLEHVIAAKAVCFGEALRPEFKVYARQVVDNAQALAAALAGRGVRLVSGGTDKPPDAHRPDRRGLHRQGTGAEAGTPCTSPPTRTPSPVRSAAPS